MSAPPPSTNTGEYDENVLHDEIRDFIDSCKNKNDPEETDEKVAIVPFMLKHYEDTLLVWNDDDTYEYNDEGEPVQREKPTLLNFTRAAEASDWQLAKAIDAIILGYHTEEYKSVWELINIPKRPNLKGILDIEGYLRRTVIYVQKQGFVSDAMKIHKESILDALGHVDEAVDEENNNGEFISILEGERNDYEYDDRERYGRHSPELSDTDTDSDKDVSNYNVPPIASPTIIGASGLNVNPMVEHSVRPPITTSTAAEVKSVSMETSNDASNKTIEEWKHIPYIFQRYCKMFRDEDTPTHLLLNYTREKLADKDEKFANRAAQRDGPLGMKVNVTIDGTLKEYIEERIKYVANNAPDDMYTEILNRLKFDQTPNNSNNAFAQLLIKTRAARSPQIQPVSNSNNPAQISRGSPVAPNPDTIMQPVQPEIKIDSITVPVVRQLPILSEIIPITAMDSNFIPYLIKNYTRHTNVSLTEYISSVIDGTLKGKSKPAGKSPLASAQEWDERIITAYAAANRSIEFVCGVPKKGMDVNAYIDNCIQYIIAHSTTEIDKRIIEILRANKLNRNIRKKYETLYLAKTANMKASGDINSINSNTVIDNNITPLATQVVPMDTNPDTPSVQSQSINTPNSNNNHIVVDNDRPKRDYSKAFGNVNKLTDKLLPCIFQEYTEEVAKTKPFDHMIMELLGDDVSWDKIRTRDELIRKILTKIGHQDALDKAVTESTIRNQSGLYGKLCLKYMIQCSTVELCDSFENRLNMKMEENKLIIYIYNQFRAQVNKPRIYNTDLQIVQPDAKQSAPVTEPVIDRPIPIDVHHTPEPVPIPIIVSSEQPAKIPYVLKQHRIYMSDDTLSDYLEDLLATESDTSRIIKADAGLPTDCTVPNVIPKDWNRQSYIRACLLFTKQTNPVWFNKYIQTKPLTETEAALISNFSINTSPGVSNPVLAITSISTTLNPSIVLPVETSSKSELIITPSIPQVKPMVNKTDNKNKMDKIKPKTVKEKDTVDKSGLIKVKSDVIDIKQQSGSGMNSYQSDGTILLHGARLARIAKSQTSVILTEYKTALHRLYTDLCLNNNQDTKRLITNLITECISESEDIMKECKQNIVSNVPAVNNTPARTHTVVDTDYSKLIREQLEIDDPIPTDELVAIRKDIEKNIRRRFDRPLQWKDVVGLGAIKNELFESIITSVLRPDTTYNSTHNILFYGLPGVGKTRLFECLAATTKCTTYEVKAETLVSKYLGDSEAKMKVLWDTFVLNSPSMLIINEVSDLIPDRESKGDHEVYKRITDMLLERLDLTRDGVYEQCYVLLTSNNPQKLDDAFLSRLNKEIYIPRPSLEDRVDLMKLYLTTSIAANSALSDTIRLVATKTKGYSNRDLDNIIKDARQLASRPVVPSSTNRDLDKEMLDLANLPKPAHKTKIKPGDILVSNENLMTAFIQYKRKKVSKTYKQLVEYDPSVDEIERANT